MGWLVGPYLKVHTWTAWNSPAAWIFSCNLYKIIIVINIYDLCSNLMITTTLILSIDICLTQNFTKLISLSQIIFSLLSYFPCNQIEFCYSDVVFTVFFSQCDLTISYGKRSTGISAANKKIQKTNNFKNLYYAPVICNHSSYEARE